MKNKLLSSAGAFVVACGSAAVTVCAPTSAVTAAQPLTTMSYSPLFDLTNPDRGVDPYVDFYKFSCGGWKNKSTNPADRAS